MILGGGQQDGMRSGTQSLPLAASMAVAMTEADKERKAAYERVSEINAYLREQLSVRGATINSPEDGLPFVLNVAFRNFQSETMLHCLEIYDIFISTVSACSSKSKKTSYVLEAMGIDRSVSSNSVRLSFSRYNTMEEAQAFVKAIDEIYELYEVKVR
jgi:cysteine desulfurase